MYSAASDSSFYTSYRFVRAAARLLLSFWRQTWDFRREPLFMCSFASRPGSRRPPCGCRRAWCCKGPGCPSPYSRCRPRPQVHLSHSPKSWISSSDTPARRGSVTPVSAVSTAIRSSAASARADTITKITKTRFVPRTQAKNCNVPLPTPLPRPGWPGQQGGKQQKGNNRATTGQQATGREQQDGSKQAARQQGTNARGQMGRAGRSVRTKVTCYQNRTYVPSTPDSRPVRPHLGQKR